MRIEFQEPDVRRDYARGVTRRGQLAASPLPYDPGKSLRRRLREFDPLLELYYHGGDERWSLYRRIALGVCPANDSLMKVFDLEGPNRERRPPGEWVLRKLRDNDIERKYGGGWGGEKAGRLWADDIITRNEAAKASVEKSKSDQTGELAKDMAFCLQGNVLKSTTEEAGVPVKPGRKLIWGKEGQKRIH